MLADVVLWQLTSFHYCVDIGLDEPSNCWYVVDFNITFYMFKVINEVRDFILQLGERKEGHMSVAAVHVFSPVSKFSALVTADLFVVNYFCYDFGAVLNNEMEEYISDMEACSTALSHWSITGRRDHKLHVSFKPQWELTNFECFDLFRKFVPSTEQKLNQ